MSECLFGKPLRTVYIEGTTQLSEAFPCFFIDFFILRQIISKCSSNVKDGGSISFGQVIEELFFQVDRIFIQNKNSGWINSLYSVVCINKFPHLYLIVMYLSHFTDYFDRMYFVHA